ncbi:MAG: Cytochrome b subunit of formate dehydrogenase-like protein [Actinobacteria bacterium]|nr:Cytochrome b subunit of formate dehydrogenase-like protein [Actinomycetota bacterium]
MVPLRRDSYRIAVPVIFLALCLLAAVPCPDGFAMDNGQCFDCHGDSGIISWSAREKAGNVKAGGVEKPLRHIPPFPGVSLFVDPGPYKASVHTDLSCTDCHADIKNLPHAARLATVDCSGCHAEANKAFKGSRHVMVHREAKGDAPRCVDCHGAHAIPKSSVSTSPVYFRNIAATCIRCHGDPGVTGRSKIPIPRAGRMYERSIHNRAIVDKGLNKSATCVDCHGSHSLKDRLDPSSPIFRTNIPQTCGKCHYGVYAIFKDSAHGTAFYRGVPDAPGCTECHGEHDIRQAADPGSSVSFAAVSQKTCPSCHSAERLSNRYGMATGKVKGYEETFHGLSQRLGDKTVANCSSCHGVHEIFPSRDPRSTVHPKNLKVTCGKCHPVDTENFAKGNIHVGPGGLGGQVKYWVEQIYIWMIVVVIGGMVLHNGADYIRKLQVIYRKRREWEEPGYERLNASERVQHILTLTTFFTLVITGFALKFKWSVPLLSDEFNVALRGQGHRVAAFLMVATCIYHVYYVIFTPRGRDQFARMMPRWQDAKDIVAMLKYFAGMDSHKPQFGRYSYIEKAEYLALVWGTIVMVVTGFMLWFQNDTLKHIPMWGLDVATLIHYYEAILATLAIIVWHLYYVMINPDFAPLSFTWLDGKLSRHDMEHEHPLELKEIDAKERSGEAPGPETTRIATEDP